MKRTAAFVLGLGLPACPSSSGPRAGDDATTTDASPSVPGLGAELTPTGATFRVWAPGAEAVRVSGELEAALVRNAEGIWQGEVLGAHAGQRYRYTVTYNGSDVPRSDPRARQLDDANGPSVLVDRHAYVWNNPTFVPAPFSQQIIYELHVGTFNVRPGQTHGTYASAVDRLDALAALGVNMIELLPVAEFRGDRSWGYNPGGPFAVESAYGTPDDLRALVDAAHARGIGVIIDTVHNHYASDTLLRCWDGDCLGANGIYFYTGDLASTPWGPRPNFARPEVRAYIADNAVMWLGEYHCDGLRWDSTVNIGKNNADGWNMLGSINDAINASFPSAIQIAEDWQSDPRISQPTAQGGAGFDAQWDGFVHDINTTILAGSDSARSMWTVKNGVERRFNGHASERVIFTESHDEVANGRKRIPEMISPGNPGSLIARQLSTLGASVAFTSPGVPMLFMGQEMLTGGYFADNNPLDWSRAQTYTGIVRLYSDLAHLRRNASGTTAGLLGDGVSVFHVNDSAKVIAWRRWNVGGDDVVVVANFSNQQFPIYNLGLPAGGTWKVRFQSAAAIYSPDFDTPSTADVNATQTPRDGQPFTGSVALGRYALLVLSR